MMKRMKKGDQFYEGAIALGTHWRRFADAFYFSFDPSF
jgi:hypothetical protein